MHGRTGYYDFYWIVGDPAGLGKQVGTQLLASVVYRRNKGFGLGIIVELFFFLNDAPTPEFYPLPRHAPLPISNTIIPSSHRWPSDTLNPANSIAGSAPGTPIPPEVRVRRATPP